MLNALTSKCQFLVTGGQELNRIAGFCVVPRAMQVSAWLLTDLQAAGKLSELWGVGGRESMRSVMPLN